jgi:hypothetical protein
MDYPQASQGQGCDDSPKVWHRYGASHTLRRSWIIMDNHGLCIIADYRDDLGLSWITDHRGLSLIIMDYHRLSWIMDCRGLSWIMMDCELSWIIIDGGLSRIILDYHGVSWIIMDHHGLSGINHGFPRITVDYHSLSWIIMDYRGLLWVIMIIMDYHGL